MILISLALAADIEIPRDHDLFVTETSAGAHFRMFAFAPVGTPVHIDPAASPDALHIDGTETIDVNAAGRVLYVATAGYGGVDSKGVAAEGDIVYADGRTQSLRWLVGEHAWPAWAGATGRLADPLPLGTNIAGNTMMASLRVVPLSYPDTMVSRLVLRPRGGLDMYLLAVSVNADWPAAHSEPEAAAPVGYVFSVPLAVDLGRFAPPGLPSAPIDDEGAIQVVGEKLVRRDSSEARLWGVNLVGALPEPARAKSVAVGLAARGFDLVRLHHIDRPGVLASSERAAGLARPEGLDRLDRLHAALRGEGIYQWLSIWTQLAPVPADGVDAPEGLPVGHKYAAMMWPSWREFQKRWFIAVWGRVNPYTGQAYAKDPAIAVVELSNEDGLLLGWQSGALEKLPLPHRRRLDELWIGFLRKKYATDAALVAAWQGGNRPGLQDGETLAISYVAREPSSRARTELFPARRAADLVAFYATLERDDFAEMSAFVRAQGFTAPIVCSNSLGILHADAQLSACDVVDIHAYWDPISESTAYYDASILEPSARWLERLAACQAGKPCTMSELNHTWPNRFGQEAPLTWAALGGRQGWSAIAWFAWSHADIRDLPDGPAGALDLEGRFSSDVQMPAASAIFRQLGAATARFTRAWTAGALDRDLAEPSSLFVPETVGIQSYLARRVRSSFDGAMPRGDADRSPVRWSPGRLVVDTARAAAIVGHTTPSAEAPDPQVLRASVPGRPAISLVMAGSSPGRWLLTVAGRTDRQGTWASPGVPGLLALGSGPARLERLTGFVDVRVPGRARVYALLPDGSPRERVRARRLPGGWWRVNVDAETPWFGVTTVQGD